MNELVRYLEGIEQRLKSVEDFAIAETPLLIQEFLAWEFMKHLSISLICGVFVLAVFVIFCKLWSTDFHKGEKEDPVDSWVAKGVVSLVFILLAYGPLFQLCTSGKNVGKISIAPRVYVVEKAVDLLKGIK